MKTNRAGADVKGIKKIKKVAVHGMPERINKLLTGTVTQQYKLSPLKHFNVPSC